MSDTHSTYVLTSNKAKMRMSEFPEEIPGQIAAGINRLGTRGYTFYSIYPIGSDVPYDEFPHPTEWIQTTGTAPDRLTVEIKQADTQSVHRLYTIGRSAAGPTEASEPIQNGDNTYLVHPNEVLTATEAIELFQHYYDTHAVPTGWTLREQPEYSDTANASAGRAPITTADEAKAKGQNTNVTKKPNPAK